MNKKFRAFAIGLAIFAVAMMQNLQGSSLAYAQSKIPEAVVAIVDITHVLQVSEPSKKAEEDVKALLKTKVDELNKRGDDLLAEKEALDKQRAILSPDAYQKKLSELNVQRQNLQREFQVINGKMNEVLVGIRLRFREIIVRLAADVSKEKGVNLGIDRAKTVFFNPSMDITEEVLARFNKANPKVDIKLEDTKEGAAPAKKN
ncbi:OmpH family outer membrane protein [Sneathiella sp. HT1-7]|uniref:OmpH family outer membrane protein n=1 Tax=Sneathiella sp. HT1-7 TaxID=2887192 RepID=UPI001D135445|nr:OmpH family outer membrane protein [Sneathiella sp. HT1-7]MCC3304512.1 OmpH family outer membrane protein [Sneathiella sp. HT1-7]